MSQGLRPLHPNKNAPAMAEAVGDCCVFDYEQDIGKLKRGKFDPVMIV